MRFTDNSAITAANMTGTDILAGTDVSAGTDKKFELGELGEYFVEDYAGSTLAGSTQSIQSAINGAIPAPSSPSSGDFLVYDGAAWSAVTLAEWQGGNY